MACSGRAETKVRLTLLFQKSGFDVYFPGGEVDRQLQYFLLTIGNFKYIYGCIGLTVHPHCRYKPESYRESEFAGRVLADNDIPVVVTLCSDRHVPRP